MIELLVAHGADVDVTDEDGRDLMALVGKSDSRPGPEERAKTAALLEELIGITQQPKRARADALRRRRQLMDSLIDGDVAGLRKVQKEAPELFERFVTQERSLHQAAWAGHGEVVDLLVELGEPMTIGVACALGRVERVTSMLDADLSLLEGDQPPRVIDKKKHLPWHERPPLMLAAMKDWLELARLLLDRGAEINRQVGWYQNTALHEAVSSHSTETVKLLLARGADVTIRT